MPDQYAVSACVDDGAAEGHTVQGLVVEVPFGGGLMHGEQVPLWAAASE
ncbi:hypothetical protein [Streptomyces sp. NPDC004728]